MLFAKSLVTRVWTNYYNGFLMNKSNSYEPEWLAQYSATQSRYIFRKRWSSGMKVLCRAGISSWSFLGSLNFQIDQSCHEDNKVFSQADELSKSVYGPNEERSLVRWGIGCFRRRLCEDFICSEERFRLASRRRELLTVVYLAATHKVTFERKHASLSQSCRWVIYELAEEDALKFYASRPRGFIYWNYQ